MSSRDSDNPEWMNVLLCGGIAGVITWASVFPLGTRVTLRSAIVTNSSRCNQD